MTSRLSDGKARALFVVGLYRSGTSLLYSLLNKHPAIALMFECEAVCVPGFTPNERRWPHWARRAEFWNQTFSRHKIGTQEQERAKDLSMLYRLVAKRKGAAISGEKSPACCRWLGKLARLFPDARFIILLRELPDVYRSARDAARQGSRAFNRPGYLARLIWFQRRLIHDARKLQAKSVPVFYVRYREIVDDPVDATQRICSFLGIEFDPAMGSAAGADLSAVYQAPHHEHLRSGIVKRRVPLQEISEGLKLKLRLFSIASGQPAYCAAENLPPLNLTQRLHYGLNLALGCILCSLDDMKRLLYEFLPLAWLRWYRAIRPRFKSVVIAVFPNGKKSLAPGL